MKRNETSNPLNVLTCVINCVSKTTRFPAGLPAAIPNQFRFGTGGFRRKTQFCLSCAEFSRRFPDLELTVNRSMRRISLDLCAGRLVEDTRKKSGLLLRLNRNRERHIRGNRSAIYPRSPCRQFFLALDTPQKNKKRDGKPRHALTLTGQQIRP